MINRILVGTAAAEVTGATLELAAELAVAHGAELVVLRLETLIDARRVFDPGGVPPRTSHAERLGDTYPGLRVRTSEASGYPLRTICEVAADEQPDLIVLGRPRGHGTDALLSRRASNALVERAACAVLLVAS